jgi:hypothetical protein
MTCLLTPELLGLSQWFIPHMTAGLLARPLESLTWLSPKVGAHWALPRLCA